MDARIAQLEILNEVARIATLDLELRPMLQRITDALARKFDWEFVALITIDEKRETFVCQAVTTAVATDIHAGYMRSLGSGIVGQVAATGKPVLVDDVRTFPNYIETMEGARSELCVPVHHHGRLVAVLNLESTRLAAFRNKLSLLETVADQLAGAIASAQLIDALRATQSQLEQKTRDLEAANEHLATAIETLHRISTQDGLTGVANRRHFDETLAVEWRRAARSRAALSLLMIDIDYFKRFNDASGHQAGDDCLRRVARCVQDAVHRAADLVARYGGEEFAVLLPDTDAERAIHVAETIRSRVESLNLEHPDAPCGHVTISIGLATAVPPRDGANMGDFIRCADSALYDAKRTGRNKVAS
ncbi:MAG: GGDEF domain-containing protein [Acidobacteria bacterium]|nr:GGDEF domain-containing protein [Acidobacteriota bacterium]MBV9475229.1 GGDEF domain-containing protein [Acidobacteriota bacterium]